MGDAEIVKLIHQFKSNKPTEIQSARKELLQIGKPAVFYLLDAIGVKEIPNSEIMVTLAELPKVDGIYAYTMIVQLDDVMPPDVVVEARSMLEVYGMDSNPPRPQKKKKECVESIDIEIDPLATQCNLSLEHTFSDSGCYWLYVGISLSSPDKKLAGYSLDNASKEAVQALIANLEAHGFSRTDKSNAREWEYITYKR